MPRTKDATKPVNTTAVVLLLVFVVVMGVSTVFSLKDLQLSFALSTSRAGSTGGGSQSHVVAVRDASRNSLDRLPNAEQRWTRYREMYRYQAPQQPRADTSAELCGQPPEFSNYFGQKPVGRSMHRSVNDEDATIYKLFRNQIQKMGRNGTYVELGAFDGVTESNSRFFDVCLGWKGLLIEGNPRKYDALTQNRPNAHRMSFAPSCSIKDELENATVRFHAVVFPNAGLEGHALGYKEGRKVVEVPCGSLTPVLTDVLGGHVDFFSLDVEGSEPLILDNIDFDKVFIEMLMVESWNLVCKRNEHCESRERARARMKEAGYKRYSNAVYKSDLYIHPKSEKFQMQGVQPDG